MDCRRSNVAPIARRGFRLASYFVTPAPLPQAVEGLG
jgi:hypothetical protein